MEQKQRTALTGQLCITKRTMGDCFKVIKRKQTGELVYKVFDSFVCSFVCFQGLLPHVEFILHEFIMKETFYYYLQTVLLVNPSSSRNTFIN